MTSDPSNLPMILLIGNFLSGTTGTRSVSEELNVRIQQAGYHTITSSSDPNRVKRLIDMCLTTLRDRNNYRFAMVEVYSGFAFRWAEIVTSLLRALRKPYILTLHGGKLPEFSRSNSGRLRSLLSSASFVTTPSIYLQHALSEYHQEIRYIPNALEIVQYDFRHRENVQPNLIWLRAFHEIYAPEVAVEAMRLLLGDFPETQLTMIGPDKRDGSLDKARSIAANSGFGDRLKVVGPVPKTKVPAWLGQADIFLNTTRYESFGVSVMEAAAVGLCIVTTDVGELKYLWQHESNAMLVHPGDPELVNASVRRILTEPGLAANLSKNARNKAEQFSWEIILPQWLALFNEM